MRNRTVDKKGNPVVIGPAKCCGNCIHYDGIVYESFGMCKIVKTIQVVGANETVLKSSVSETDECPLFSGNTDYQENHK